MARKSNRAALVLTPTQKVLLEELAGSRTGTQLAQFSEDCGPAPPLLELPGSQPMPQPGIQPAHDLGCLRQPEVRLPARHVGPQPFSDLRQAAPAGAPRQLPKPAEPEPNR